MKDKIIEVLKSYKESIIDDSSRLPEYAVMESDFNDLTEELVKLFCQHHVICRRGLLLGLLNSMSSNQFDNGDHSDIVDEYLAKQ